MDEFDLDQQSSPLDTTAGSAISANNPSVPSISSRRGCPRNSALTEVCGIVKRSKVGPNETPWKPNSKVDGDYHCCLCQARFSRKHSVKAHFVKCVDRNGNPDGKTWSDHPSIGMYRPRRVTPKQQRNRPADPSRPISYPTSSGLPLPSEIQASPNDYTPGESPSIDPSLLETASGSIPMGGTTQHSPRSEDNLFSFDLHWPPDAFPFLDSAPSLTSPPFVNPPHFGRMPSFSDGVSRSIEETSSAVEGRNRNHNIQTVGENDAVQSIGTQADDHITIRPGFSIRTDDGHTITYYGQRMWSDGVTMWGSVL